MPKITKRLVEAADVREKDYIICDNELRGFAVRVLPSGKRYYLVQYRIGTRYRRMSIGQHGVLTAETARRTAFNLLAAVKDGKDPAGDRREGRKALTVAELAQRFDKEHITVRLKPGTAREYRRNLRRFILPAIGRLKVADVSKADVARLHHELRHIPYQANRNLEVVSKMFNLAELWGLRSDGSNPRRHLRKYPEEKRERYLSPAELAALGDALSRAEQERVEDPYAIAAIRLLIFTGCRLNEIMTLKWSYVDFEARCLRLPDTKTGARIVHLGAPSLDVLSRIERLPDNPWVTCGKKPRAENRPAAALATLPQAGNGAALGPGRRHPRNLARHSPGMPTRPRAHPQRVPRGGREARARAADRPRGRSHPRPPPFVRIGRRGPRREPANDRQTPRPHSGPDDRPIRSSRR